MDTRYSPTAEPWNEISLLRQQIQELEKLQHIVEASWQSLLAREEQFHKLTESAPDAIVSLDDGGRITSWNRAAEKMFAYQTDDVLGRELTALAIAPPSRAQYESALKDLRTTAQGRGMDAKIALQAVRDGGVQFPIEMLLSGVTINDKWQTTALIRDVTERTRTEADVRQLTAIIRDATDAITVQDFAGRIVAWNRTAERMYGWSESEALEMTAWNLVPKEKAEETAALFSTLMRGGDRVLLETQRVTKSGDTADVLVTALALTDEAGTPVAIATTERDLSENAAAEQELREHLAELSHTARMSSASEFVTELANELSQPVAAIMANVRASARMLEAGELNAENLSEIIEDISGESSRTGEIIRRLQDFVRSTSRQRHAADLNAIVGRVCHLIDMEARHLGCDVRLALAQDLPCVMADEIQIQQVVSNLVRNSLEAVDDTPSAHAEIELATSVTREGEVELSVRDSGHGIPKEIAQRVFEPLFTTKPKCIGLGLSIARSVAEAHGGCLRIKSQGGRGTVCRLTLPASDQ